MDLDNIIIDLEESYRKELGYYFIFLCFIIFILGYLMLILVYAGFQLIIFLALISIFIVIIFLGLHLSYQYSVFKEKRKIIISERQILIKVPNTPLFQIEWDEFDSLVIKAKKKEWRVRKYEGFSLNFIREKVIQKITLKEDIHFKKQRLEEIIKILRNTANKKNKKVNLSFK